MKSRAVLALVVVGLASLGINALGDSEASPGGSTAYQREFFGSGWIDADRDGCNTRAEVLIRDLTNERVQREPRCRVLSGVYSDPYTDITGEALAEALDVDHVVALADAWASGAHAWTYAERRQFANDEANLLAVNDTINRQKSDKGPDRWSPPNPAGNCRYAEVYVSVKTEYDLALTSAQRKALDGLLEDCPAP